MINLKIINQRISKLNDNESSFNTNLVADIRSILDKYRSDATLYLGGPTMITSDMMDYIRSDLVLFGTSVALIFCNHALLVFWKYLACHPAISKCFSHNFYYSWFFRFYGLEN